MEKNTDIEKIFGKVIRMRSSENFEEYIKTDLIEKEGIFFSEIKSDISYPEAGNALCYSIEDDSFWFKHRNYCIIEAVKKYAPNKLFFDVGGGNGFVAKGLQDSGIESVLLEPGEQGCYNAKKRGLKNIICSTLEEASLKNNSIPAIGLFDVVEHIDNDQLFLEKINSLLMQEGLVFITVPAYKKLWSNEDADAGHFRRYTLKEINKKLKKSGYKIAYATYFFLMLPIPILIFRTIPHFLRKRNNSDIDKHTSEHNNKKGLLGKIMNNFFKIEVSLIKNGRKIPFGSSCLIVAKKV